MKSDPVLEKRIIKEVSRTQKTLFTLSCNDESIFDIDIKQLEENHQLINGFIHITPEKTNENGRSIIIQRNCSTLHPGEL